MMARTFVIFIFIFHLSHGFEVKQPRYRTVNPDASASISCEHTANVTSVVDVRLYSLRDSRSLLLCQKGMNDCGNVIMRLVSPNECLFILVNVGPEAMNVTYECEFTVNKDHLDYTERGKPTRLLPGTGQKETETDCVLRPPPPPPPLQMCRLSWILIGLLALMFLFACVITCVYVRQRATINISRDPENCTYVEMRKAPLLKH
ncbi:Hypothetical protein SMAX5B_003062 [Scophthalmus maximus]|uniref:Inducible T-cell costimulator n=2 Tax=Scophthalmus maximus TaxID=52904 RepID=A0A2U9CFL5_SCOMX|nr:Hypothetical protein SMAX5B_003062 [Scophthalmus maximus]